jgi:xanthine dehydrogenase YagS FAD-binding subunit
MQPFAFRRAATEDEAIALAVRNQATFVAGGTTLVDLMKLNVVTPGVLVDINALPLTGIAVLADGTLKIGALVRNSDLAHHPEVVSDYPVLSQALLAGASAQLRNMATVGGNLLQRTRCYYFRDPIYPCNKRTPGAGCAAIDGYNRIHAVLGGSEHCIATHPSDMAVALVALDADVHIRGKDGDRRAPITDFHLLPGDTPHEETVVAPGELVTHVTIPPRPFARRSAYVKLRDRASFEFALASTAAAIELDGSTIRDVRIALGGVATKPWRATDAEETLKGHTLDDKILEAAANAALRGATPRRHNAYKIELAKRAVIRALRLAASASDGNQS